MKRVDRVIDVANLIQALLEAAKETASELSRQELDPDRLFELMKRREETFADLQGAYTEALAAGTLDERGIATDPRLRELVRELLALDRSNMETMQSRLEELRGDVSQAKLQRRTLTAYGWVDPVHTPRGAFIDRTQG